MTVFDADSPAGAMLADFERRGPSALADYTDSSLDEIGSCCRGALTTPAYASSREVADLADAIESERNARWLYDGEAS